MRGTSKDGDAPRAPRPRIRLVGLVSSLALIVSPSLGVVGPGAAAGAAPRAKPTPIDKVQVDRFQGLRFGRDPSLTSSWTSGNLCGSSRDCYHELDDVPFRIGFKALKIGTAYTITVLIDARDRAGHLGYDNINSVVPQFGIADAVSVVQNADTTDGCGSTTCESYTFTFTASDNRAEIRFTAHLAIGAHQFGGASLSVRLADVGTRNIPLPVKEILLDIRAHKLNDLNGNGTQDAGEPDLAGWTMTLYAGTTCEGRPVSASGNPGVTDASGNVDWIDLSADQGMGGEFSVAETLQAGWENTLPGPATTNARLPCVVVAVVGGQNFADFGNR
ncbi:MAG TPA: hypothetical protein VJ259_08310, partial [Actinomycetota bacterium]|nr:hypothetical protein [Actinomycetota bacterium]